MQPRTDDLGGVSGQGGSGAGGGAAASRHRGLQPTPSTHRTGRPAVECVSCSRTLTGTAIVVAGRVYCTWDCAVSTAGTVPGQYFG